MCVYFLPSLSLTSAGLSQSVWSVLGGSVLLLDHSVRLCVWLCVSVCVTAVASGGAKQCVTMIDRRRCVCSALRSCRWFGSRWRKSYYNAEDEAEAIRVCMI